MCPPLVQAKRASARGLLVAQFSCLLQQPSRTGCFPCTWHTAPFPSFSVRRLLNRTCANHEPHVLSCSSQGGSAANRGWPWLVGELRVGFMHGPTPEEGHSQIDSPYRHAHLRVLSGTPRNPARYGTVLEGGPSDPFSRSTDARVWWVPE